MRNKIKFKGFSLQEGHEDMNVALDDFLKTKINLEQLKKACGQDLYNVKITTPRKVYAKDIIFLINQYISDSITLQEVVDWVNVVWFTDLFEYNQSEEEAIASVMSVLETLDEDNVKISDKELMEIMKCLSNNNVYYFTNND